MTEREKKLRAFGFKPVEDPALIEAHRKEWEKVAKDLKPIVDAFNDWHVQSRKVKILIG